MLNNDLLKSVQGAIMGKNTKAKEAPIEEEVRYTSGCTLLDLAVGGAKGVLGFLGGKWVNLVGDTQAGKSLLAVETVVANKYKYKDSLKVFYNDTEDGNTFDIEGRHGFEIRPRGVDNSETVEEMSYQFTRFLEGMNDGEKGIYVVDSLDGLADKATVEMDVDRNKAFDKDKEYTQETYGMGLAKFLSSNYFKLKHGLLKRKQALCVITSQVRHNVGAGPYGTKFIRAGGKALDLYANYIIWLKTLQVLEIKGRAVGAVVEARIKKAKVARPLRVVIYTVIYDYGIDDIASNLDFLFNLRSEKTGELLKRAESIEWEEGVPAMSKDELIAYIEEKKLKKVLRQRVMEKWEEFEDELASKRTKYGDDDDE
jgi:RecA/RadA recombinase